MNSFSIGAISVVAVAAGIPPAVEPERLARRTSPANLKGAGKIQCFVRTAGDREAGSGIGLGLVRNRQADPGIGRGEMLPQVFAVARVAGAALLSLGVACWLARDDRQSCAARGIVAALLLYNVAAVAVLVYAGLGLKLSAIGLWPVVFLHVALAAWCIACLRPVNPSSSEGTQP